MNILVHITVFFIVCAIVHACMQTIFDMLTWGLSALSNPFRLPMSYSGSSDPLVLLVFHLPSVHYFQTNGFYIVMSVYILVCMCLCVFGLGQNADAHGPTVSNDSLRDIPNMARFVCVWILIILISYADTPVLIALWPRLYCECFIIGSIMRVAPVYITAELFGIADDDARNMLDHARKGILHIHAVPKRFAMLFRELTSCTRKALGTLDGTQLAEMVPPCNIKGLGDVADVCAICHSDMSLECDGPAIFYCRLPCRHAFHYDCVVPWICEKQGSCPVCVTPILGSVSANTDHFGGDHLIMSHDTKRMSSADFEHMIEHMVRAAQ